MSDSILIMLHFMIQTGRLLLQNQITADWPYYYTRGY